METISCSITAKRRTFVFIAHWIENWTWMLQYSNILAENPNNHLVRAIRWPIGMIASLIYMFLMKGHDIVERYWWKLKDGTTVNGKTDLIRNFAWHYLSPRGKAKMRQNILQAVLDAQKNGVDVIGLGALCKDETVSKGGQWIVDQLGNKLWTPITHGDGLTAATVIKQCLELIKLFSLDGKPVMITGATSKVGRPIALELARRGVKVFMHTQSLDRFELIQKEASANAHLLVRVETFQEAAEAGLWITGKANKGAGEKLIQCLPEGAVVMNFAVPDPLTPKLLKKRPDVHHFDGGMLTFDQSRTSMHFPMRLRRGFMFACNAGTLVHCAMGWKLHEVGPVVMADLPKVWEATMDCGFCLPPPTSFLNPVDGEMTGVAKKKFSSWVNSAAKTAAVW